MAGRKTQKVHQRAATARRVPGTRRAPSRKGPHGPKPRVEDVDLRFRLMADSSPVLLWTAGTDKLCDYFNKGWLEFRGRTMEEELGNGWAEGVHPDDLDRCLRVYTESFDLHQSFRMEYRLQRHDGVYRWILDSGVPRFTPGGEFQGYIGSCIDITERRDAEQLLRRGKEELEHRIAERTTELWRTLDQVKASEENLRVILNAVYDGIILHTVDGKIIDVNDKVMSMYGITRDEAMHLSIARDLSAPGNPFDALADIWQSVLAGENRIFEWKARRPADGAAFDVEVFLRRIRLNANDVIMATVRDVTSRKQLERELRQTERMEMVKTVVGGIAHDFNNILNNVMGFAFLLKKYADQRDRTLKYSEVIEEAVRRGTELADRLLTVATTNSTEHLPLQPAEVVLAAVERFQLRYPAGGAMHARIPDNLPMVLGDREALVQVLTHLLVNAREAIDRGGEVAAGTIVVTARVMPAAEEGVPLTLRGKECVDIAVQDSGPGILPAVYERMFEPFISTKGAGQAAGLGLAVAYATARTHGGTISAEPPAQGGAVVHLWLPAAQTGDQADPPPGRQTGKQPEGCTILLVDDEPAMQVFGRDILEAEGYTVVTASDGVEAVELFRQRGDQIDLVILDLVMPRMDGGHAYLEMKALRDDVRALFCTGFTSDQVITSLLRDHGLKALKKPFDVNVFLAAVREALGIPGVSLPPAAPRPDHNGSV